MRSRYKVKLNKRRNLFYEHLARATDAFYSSPFFGELEDLGNEVLQEQLRLERYRRRRAANEAKAYRVLKRLRKVQAIDLFKMTQHIEPNFFNEKTEQFKVVKALYDKKARIVWFLQGLYNYLAFDYESHEWSAKRGFHYSRHRKHWNRMLDQHREKLRQAKWDLKREKVRRRRGKIGFFNDIDDTLVTLYKLKYGVGTKPPV